MSKDNYKVCSHPKHDCVSNQGGHCVALYDTSFPDKTCPFYMNAETKKQTIRECVARNIKKGIIRASQVVRKGG